MKKQLFILTLCISLVMLFTGCSKEITLNLAYGDRTGKYSGDLSDGVPNGHGSFTASNDEGEAWTYEGEFRDGHFEGEGQTTWENGHMEKGTYKNDVLVAMKGDEIKTLFTLPENFKNRCVELVGKVFTAPEYTDDGVALQMWTDFQKLDKNVIVYVSDKDFKVKQDEYVKVIGIVGDVFEGSNLFGAALSVPTVSAKECKVISYTDAASPTVKTIEVNQTQEQYGYSVTIQKVEFADNETRVYIKAANNGSDKFNLYSFNTKITQNGKQYEEQDNWEADYPKVQTGLLVGNNTEGIIAFPAIEQTSFSVVAEASSENYSEEFKPYQFNIEVK